MHEYRRFHLAEDRGVTIVHLVDPRIFDTLVVSDLEDELLDMVELQAPQKLLIDFEDVTQCSTSVINGLLRAKKRLLGRGGQLGLCGMTASIRSAYRMLNLDGTVFKIFDTREQAVAEI
ncbi:MAG: STAS domain-containing protein [Pirellulaceae bacterium]